MLQKFDHLSCNRFVVPDSATISGALVAIEAASTGAVLIADPAGRVLGIVTDGDIRRAMISGLSIDDAVTAVANTDFFSVLESEPPAKALSLAKQKSLTLLPILTDLGLLAGVFVKQTTLPTDAFETPVLIMAGGRGVRMGDLTQFRPKPLLEVNGLPLIDGVIGTAIAGGFKNFYVSLNFMGHLIEQHLTQSLPADVSVEFLWEKNPMGTAGAIGALKGKIRGDFLVMNADVFHNVDLSDLLEFHRHKKAVMTLVALEYVHDIPFGVLEMSDHGVTAIKEKPSVTRWINAGVYALSDSIFSSCDFEEPCDMTDVATTLISASQPVAPYFFDGFWMDLGNREALEKATIDFRDPREVAGGGPQTALS